MIHLPSRHINRFWSSSRPGKTVQFVKICENFSFCETEKFIISSVSSHVMYFAGLSHQRFSSFLMEILLIIASRQDQLYSGRGTWPLTDDTPNPLRQPQRRSEWIFCPPRPVTAREKTSCRLEAAEFLFRFCICGRFNHQDRRLSFVHWETEPWKPGQLSSIHYLWSQKWRIPAKKNKTEHMQYNCRVRQQIKLARKAKQSNAAEEMSCKNTPTFISLWTSTEQCTNCLFKSHLFVIQFRLKFKTVFQVSFHIKCLTSLLFNRITFMAMANSWCD